MLPLRDIDAERSEAWTPRVGEAEPKWDKDKHKSTHHGYFHLSGWGIKKSSVWSARSTLNRAKRMFTCDKGWQSRRTEYGLEPTIRDHLKLQLQGIWCSLLAYKGTSIYVVHKCLCPAPNKLKNKSKNLLFMMRCIQRQPQHAKVVEKVRLYIMPQFNNDFKDEVFIVLKNAGMKK